MLINDATTIHKHKHSEWYTGLRKGSMKL